MDATNLVAWLRFDESTTADKCGNSWTAYGSPTIENGALQIANSSQYVKLADSIYLGGQDFTVATKIYVDSSAGNLGAPFTLYQGTTRFISLFVDSSTQLSVREKEQAKQFKLSRNQWHYVELDYQHSAGTLKCYVDGTLAATISGTLTRTELSFVALGTGTWNGSEKFIGSIDEFQIYDGVALHTANFTPPTAADYEDLAFQLDGGTVFTVDVERVIKNDAYIKQIAQSLKVWLPFDESATADKCGNEWTAYGSPTISNANAINGNALQLNGSSYVQSNGTITLGGKDFTITWHVAMNSSTTSWGTLFEATTSKGGNNRIEITRCDAANTLRIYANEMWGFYQDVNIPANTRFYLELDYQHSASKLRIFVDGVLAATVSKSLAAQNFIALTHGWGTKCTNYFTGTIDEFQIYDGVALHTENFTPPTAAEYEELAFQLDSLVEFTVDVERKLSNRVEFTADVERKVINAWRYFNAGTADTLTVTGTTLENLPDTKSVTGTAFYQTTGAKCFDLPATDEVWLKFDVYFNGSQRWRAYNGGANGVTGITAQTNNEISYFTNGGDNSVHSATDAAKKNQLQTVILHMISGSSAGVIETWVDGDFIYRYTGDVNHGEDFADIYLQSDGAGTFFSNVIISNREIGLNDGYQKFTADVERRTTKRIEFAVDVERSFIQPLIIPFVMGDHFNHLIQNIRIMPDTLIKIKLPKESKAYLHADGINGGAVKIYSDTDDTGTVTGDVYAAFDECESVFIQSTVSPQSILYEFMYKLRNTGGNKLDEAIQYCTGGLFSSKDELADSFLNDLNNSESNLDFLSRCCGVDLFNDDTGAVIGSDAGGGYPKTAELIVPEPVPVEDWIVPEKGSSKTIDGLTVQFPTSGLSSSNFTDAEKHILAGLNSVWIEQVLELIKRSCGLKFSVGNTVYIGTKKISVKFVNETNNTLAYVAVTYNGSWASNLELRINMRYYSGINMTSEDGATQADDVYLDRTLAHELTHAVMAASIGAYSDLPLFIKEGIAEFIHGIDDERKSRIQYITQPFYRTTLQSIFSTGGTSGDTDVYPAGYLFFRYMIKQTLERGNISAGVLYLSRLFISEGAVDYFGNALTDNTRTSFSADTQRELVRTTSFNADVAIFDMIPVEFAADIIRAIKAKVKMFAVDSSEYFSGSSDSGTLNPVVIPPQETIPAAPDNTIGLQSIEISLGEQQLTDNIAFVGVVPFDIMYPVKGQYLDYVFDMRVERVQQKGILYSCECCSDVDQLLYTQLAYTVPQSTDWQGAGESTDTTTNDDKSVSAKFHASSIARTIGKTPVMQFDDFASTVLTENLGGATYADMIRDVFGWSSRVPTQMINVFIRDDKIYFVQRGHEARLIDLSGTKHTIPTITHELVRMTWGSTPWSKTETREVEVYRPPDTSTNGTGGSSGTGSIGGGSGSGSGTIGDGVSSISGGSDKVIKYKGGGDQPATPVNDDGEEESVGVLTVSDSFNGYPESGYTRYVYDKKGLLIQTFTYVHNQVTGKNTYTTVNQSYDEDGTLIYSWTFVQSMDSSDGNSSSSTTISKGYLKLNNGEKFLARESSVTYTSDDSLTPTDLVESKTILHSPSRAGQGRATVIEDGEFTGGIVGQNTGDDRVTPYRRGKANELAETALQNSLKAAKRNAGTGTGTGGLSTPEEIYAAYQANHEANYYTEQQSRTLNGLSLYDSSFPIHNVGKLVELTAAIKWLNRRTKETVTMTIYEYPHLIDFNDRIIFNGSEYFLVSNVATTNARIFNEQRVTFTRWY